MFADDFTALEHAHICIMNCEMTYKKYALIIKIRMKLVIV